MIRGETIYNIIYKRAGCNNNIRLPEKCSCVQFYENEGMCSNTRGYHHHHYSSSKALRVSIYAKIYMLTKYVSTHSQQFWSFYNRAPCLQRC